MPIFCHITFNYWWFLKKFWKIIEKNVPKIFYKINLKRRSLIFFMGLKPCVWRYICIFCKQYLHSVLLVILPPYTFNHPILTSWDKLTSCNKFFTHSCFSILHTAGPMSNLWNRKTTSNPVFYWCRYKVLKLKKWNGSVYTAQFLNFIFLDYPKSKFITWAIQSFSYSIVLWILLNFIKYLRRDLRK